MIDAIYEYIYIYMMQYVDFCICMDLSRFVCQYVPICANAI